MSNGQPPPEPWHIDVIRTGNLDVIATGIEVRAKMSADGPWCEDDVRWVCTLPVSRGFAKAIVAGFIEAGYTKVQWNRRVVRKLQDGGEI